MISNIDLRSWPGWPEGVVCAAGFFFVAGSTGSDFKLAAAGRFIWLPVSDSTAAAGRFKLAFGLALAFSLTGGGGSTFFFTAGDFAFGFDAEDFDLALASGPDGAA